MADLDTVPVTVETLVIPAATNGGPHPTPTHASRIIVRPPYHWESTQVQQVAQVTGQMGGFDTATWSPIFLVAERAGQLIGLIQVMPGKPVSILTAFGVVPAHRHSRAAYKLIEGAELALRLTGYTNWIAYTSATRVAWHDTITKWGAVEDSGPLYQFTKQL